jgi:hypothetical protein
MIGITWLAFALKRQPGYALSANSSSSPGAIIGTRFWGSVATNIDSSSGTNNSGAVIGSGVAIWPASVGKPSGRRRRFARSGAYEPWAAESES